jgi:putative sterol carrier protein
LHWDENGCLKRLSHYDGAAPSFRAAEREWGAFISGEYSAVAGVMAGRIEYKGKMSFALRYGASFDTVAEVARNAQ